MAPTHMKGMNAVETDLLEDFIDVTDAMKTVSDDSGANSPLGLPDTFEVVGNNGRDVGFFDTMSDTKLFDVAAEADGI